MRSRNAWFRALLVAALFLPTVAAQDPGPREITGVRRALLIGIDAYEHVTRLRGCVNDVKLMAHILKTRYGFTDVTVLTDERATRRGILDALARVVKRTEAGDGLFIHYSGHGSHVEDFAAPGADSGDEDDGQDETLVPLDGRGGVDADGNPVLDITDDELDKVLRELKTENVWIFLDACHSRSGTRSEDGEVRGRDLPADMRTELYRKAVRDRSTGVQTYDSPHVLLTSASESEKALDGPVDGVYHGLFTRALATVLARQSFLLSAEETWRQAGEEYGRIVEQLGVTHRASTPMLQVGRKEWAKEPFLLPPADGTGARLPWLTVRGRGRKVLLLNGRQCAVAEGSQWRLYPAGDDEFAPGRARAWGEVRAFNGDHAVLQLTGVRKGMTAFDGYRAVQDVPPPGDSEVRVKVRAAGVFRDRLEESLRKAVPGARLVPDDASQSARFKIAYESGEYRVYGGDGTTEIGVRGGPEGAAGLLTRALTANQLLDLENPTSTMTVRISTDRNDGIDNERVDGRDIEVIRATGARSTKYRVYRDGDEPDDGNCLLLNVAVEQDCYITVVNVDGKGKVNQLFPNRYSEEADYYPDGFVEAFQTARLPDRIAVPNDAGYNLALRSVGREAVQVFATEDLETAQRIRNAIQEIENAQSDADNDAREDVERILDELRSDLLAASRGIEPVPTRRRPQNRERPEPEPDPDPPERDNDLVTGFDADVELGDITDWTTCSLTIVVGKGN